MFYLAEHELDAISSPSSTVNWTFFGVSASAALAFLIVLLTITLPADKQALFAALDLAAGVMTAYFLVMGLRDQFRANRRIAEIKQRVV